MRLRIRNAILFLPAVVVLVVGDCKLWPADQAAEPNRFFHDFVGLTDDQIHAIRDGKAVAKVLESPTPDEVFVFGSVYIDSTPERYLAVASNIDALRRLPGYLAILKFSDPPQLADLAGFTLEDEDITYLARYRVRVSAGFWNGRAGCRSDETVSNSFHDPALFQRLG